MKSVRAVTVLVIGLGLTSAVNASVISFSTRQAIGVPVPFSDAAAVKSYVDGLLATPAGSGYCDASPAAWNGLSNQTNCGGGATNIAFHMGATFSVSPAQAGVWNFRIGPDFGLGGALFVDGVAVDFKATDMWWNGNYDDPSQLLTASLNLGAGVHVVEAYGAEACCDGAQQAQYLAPGRTDYVIFGADDGLTPVALPEPASVALIGLALAGIGGLRRRWLA